MEMTMIPPPTNPLTFGIGGKVLKILSQSFLSCTSLTPSSVIDKVQHFYHLDYVVGVQFLKNKPFFTTPSEYSSLSHLSTSYEVPHPGLLKDFH